MEDPTDCGHLLHDAATREDGRCDGLRLPRDRGGSSMSPSTGVSENRGVSYFSTMTAA